MKAWIRNHPVGALLSILYPLSWLFFLPAFLGKLGLGIIPVDIPREPGLLAMVFLGMLGLPFLITYIANGRAGVRELLRRFYRLRVGAQWYLVAVFLCPALLFVVSLVMHGGAASTPFRNHATEIVTVYLMNLVILAVVVNLAEECTWMAFVTARLQRRWGPVAASIAVGPMFGFIHVPLVFIVGGVTDGKPEGAQILEYLFYLMILFTGPVRILVTWVYNSTGGSLLLVALLHQSIDQTASSAILTTFFPGVDGRLLYVAVFVFAVALVVITRGRLGYRTEPPAIATQPAPAAAVGA